MEVQGIGKWFGGLHALDDVSFSLEPGTVHALIGPNGAGKSTLLDIICGFTRPSTGTITFQGREVTGFPPHRIARLGVARTFQTPALYTQMTVFEHVLLALVQARKPGFATRMPTDSDHHELQSEALELLRVVGLDSRMRDLARKLPYGQRRLLEVAEGLARDPKVLLLDEPAAGLNDDEVEALKPLLQSIAERDIAVLLIEHNIPLVMSVSSWVVVLNFGRVIFVGEPRHALEDAEVLAAYLGRERQDA